MGKILVIDDSSTMRRILVNTLARLGYTDILQAADGVEGWEAYRAHKDEIEAILTDWNMPNMDGLELVKKIRAVDQDTPIVMVTTEGGKKEVITALKAGVNNYIVKPFDPPTLRKKLEAIFNKDAK